MSSDGVVDIFEKPGVPYSTSADLYSSSMIGAPLPTIETASLVNYPCGGGGPSTAPLTVTFDTGTPVVVPPSLLLGTPITPINVAASFSGGPNPKTYSVFSGTLPVGLALGSSTGLVTGTPTAAGSGSVVFRATDNAGNTANSNSVLFTTVAPVTAAWSAVDKTGTMTLTNSNKTATVTGSPSRSCRGTVGRSTGKWYFEVSVTGSANINASTPALGIATAAAALANLESGVPTVGGYWINGNGNKCNSPGGSVAYGAVADGLWMFAFDGDAGKWWAGFGGVWFAAGNPATGVNPGYTGLAGEFFPCFGASSGFNMTVVGRWAAGDLTLTPPAGFSAWG